ncbi:unnamed protein product [Ectocarpus sp. CCAP 1310/34]|nr:unnamed protein product [Ectocarpus sp. CCAP 1310/34]
MASGVKRATRNSGIAVDVNLWDLRDLPKTSTVKSAATMNNSPDPPSPRSTTHAAPKLKLKDYTVRLPRASRDQDMKLLRRAARDNEGVGGSDPVYPLTGPACITRKEAAAALLALGEERDDEMVAAARAAASESGDCGAGAGSTIADGESSIPLAMGISQPLLAEAEADARLASPGVSRNLTTEDQRSSLPHPAQLDLAQGKPDSSDDTTGAMSAAAKIAPARAGDVAGLAAAAVAKVLSRGAAEGKPVLKRIFATVVAYDIGNSMEVAGGGGKGCGGSSSSSCGGCGGSGGAFDGVAGGGIGGGQGRRFQPEHGVGGSTSSNKYKHVIGDGDVGGDSSMVDRLGKIACVWGSSTGHHGQGGDGGGKAGPGCYGNGGGASGDRAESDGAHTSGSRGYSGGYSGVTTSDDNDSSSGGDGNGTGGGIAWDNATDNTGECNVSPSELSPLSPFHDSSSFGKRNRGHDDDDNDDMVDGSGCVDVNTASGDDGVSERCAKRARQAAGGGKSLQLRGLRDRSGK